MPDNGKVDWAYVNKLRQEMQKELEGFHLRIKETEELRYLEEPIPLAPQEKQSGVEVRIGLTGELIENVKSALTNNPPKVTLKPLRSHANARDNASTREEFWNQVLVWLAIALLELADGQSGLGIGIIKGSSYPWPKEERKRKKKGKDFTETPLEHTTRIRNLKRKWGIPYRAITIHPLCFYFRLGAGNAIVEAIEHSWKPRRQVLKDYEQPLDSPNVTWEELAATIGQPEEVIRPLPYGTSTETMALVTEYWSLADDLYQVYINGQLVHEDEGGPGVRYFVATGRVTSSKDPDKFGFGVAEILRHNEPIINATMTRMAEAADLVVDKRLTLELPEGMTPETETEEATGNIIPKVYKFEKGKAEALPAGVKVKDVFEGVENIYSAMPFLELLLRISGQHGVAPIFKGKSPGAAGSGYRDVSLYAMAKSQFAYILKSYCNCVAEFVAWLEEQVVKDNKEVFIGDVSLKPSDVRDWPAIISVNVDPDLPQNIIPMAQLLDRMWAEGHIPSRLVVEKGLKEEQPQDLARERDLEDLKGLMKPLLYNHVLQVVGMLPPTPPMPGAPGEGDVTALRTPAGAQPTEEPPGRGESAQAAAGYGRGGQPRVPPEVSEGISEEEGLA